MSNSVGTIYLIDDEADILDVEKELLETHNYKVKAFLHYKELLKAIEDEKPHLILSDMKMPEIDGLVLFNEIRKTHASIPVVFVSGFLTKDVVIKAMQAGAFSVLEKPFRHEAVLDVCKQAVSRSTALRAFDKIIPEMKNISQKLKIEKDESKRTKELESLNENLNKVSEACLSLNASR